jgi:predicted DNA-binding WGR domain protein/ADP-ribose pyrophosphatase YjhB (NUDIX family)
MSEHLTATAIAVKLALQKARLEVAKASFGAVNRWPAGSSKGGQFAPKGASGNSAQQLGLGGNTWKESGWAGSGMWSKPKTPPPGAKQHPQKDEKGNPVIVNYPTPASPASTWSNPKAVATFTPGGKTPEVLNGVPFKSWTPPKAGWAAVSGTNEKFDEDFPFEPHPTKKTGAGVIILEPDGRVWLTKPTNEFGNYKQTFPKGTAESGLTLQQNAIKEAWEETGLKVQIVGIAADIERDTSKARFYIARRVGGTPKDMGWESQALRLAPRKQAAELLNRSHDKALLNDILDEMGVRKAKDAGTKESGKPGAWQFQERWPAGSSLGGQWKAMGADGITAPPKIAGGLDGANSIYQKAANLAHECTQGSPTPDQLQKIIDKYAPSAAKFASGAKASSHVKWGAQVHQYATQAMADFKAKGSATATADKLQGPQKLSAMTYAGGKPGGSNPGGMYADADGKWLVKGSNSGDATPRSKNEVLASKLMLAVGAGAPDMKLVDLEGKHGGGIGVASKWVSGGVAFDAKNPAHYAAAQADFAVHAWLANYDVLGMSMDNTQIVGGKAVNIDPGGALLYRAQGAPKGDTFKTTADEWDSLRDPTINANGAKVYGSMTASKLAESAEKLKAIDDAGIKKLVDTYGPGTQAEKDALTSKLIARKADILARVAKLQGTVASTPAPAPAAAPAPVSAPAQTQTILAEKLTFVGGGSDKFWQVGVVGTKVVTQWGKNGTKGQQTFKEMGSASAAAKAASKMWLEKKEKGYKDAGYVDMTVDLPAKPAPAPAAAAPAVSAPATAVAKPPLPTFTSIHKEKYKAVAELMNRMSAAELAGAVQSAYGKQGSKLVFGSGSTTVTTNNPPKSDDGKALYKFYQGLKNAAATPPAAAPATSSAVVEKPANWPLPGTKKFFTGLAGEAEKLHADGNLADLKFLATNWNPNTANGKVMSAYHAKLVADLQSKQATQTMATVQAAQAAVSHPVSAPANGTAPNGVPMPDFQKFKLPAINSNAPSHNAKVDKIADLAGKGDVKGLLSLNYGTNNYAKKQVQLANDALAALGSPFAVTVGQKQNAHPALTGGVPPLKVQQAAAVTGQQAPAPHPATQGKPDMTKLDTSKAVAPPKPHFDKSSKAWVNESNNKLAAEIAAKFAAGDYLALQTMKYQEVDKDTGKAGGFKHMSEHPAKDLKAYFDASLTVMREVAYPPKPLKVFQAQHANSVKAIAAAFPSKPFGTTVDKVASNEKVGFWVALGKVDDISSITPGKTMKVSSADEAKAYSDYQSKITPLAKAFINGIQSSGSYNDLFRDGKKTVPQGFPGAGHTLAEVAQAAAAYAQTKPAGTRITRWQHMSADMVKKLESAGPGTVLQATGSMCCSKSDTATKAFGPHKITIVYADGAKAVDSFGSGNYSGEQEVTTLPNARFVVLKVGKQTNGNAEVTLLMLPPDLGIKKP